MPLARGLRQPRAMRSLMLILVSVLVALSAQPAFADDDKEHGRAPRGRETTNSEAVRPALTRRPDAEVPRVQPQPKPRSQPTAPDPPRPAPPPTPRALDPTAVPATAEPTAEPTLKSQVIDISNDPNARSQRTVVTPAPTPTAVPTVQPSPTTPPRASDLVDGVVAQSFEPVMAGGRLGLAGAAFTALGWLAMRLVRRRR